MSVMLYPCMLCVSLLLCVFLCYCVCLFCVLRVCELFCETIRNVFGCSILNLIGYIYIVYHLIQNRISFMMYKYVYYIDNWYYYMDNC